MNVTRSLPSLAAPIAVAVLALTLGGCATRCTGDARYDSLSCASQRLSSGAYQRQTYAMRDDAWATEQRARRTQAAAGDASARAEHLRGAADNQSSSVARLDGEIADLQSQLQQDRGRLAAMRARGESAGTIQALEAENARREQRIERLRRSRSGSD